MMNSAHLIGPFKHFVKGCDESKTSSVKSDEVLKSIPRTAFVSGSHVKQFYVKTVGEEAFKVSDKERLRNQETIGQKVKQRNSASVPFNVNTFMKAVEIGQLRDVEKILNDHKDQINCIDQYGWTPLMSACCAGDQRMVELLLRWDPELEVRDKKGNTCRQLALARGHKHIVNIIDNHRQQNKSCGNNKKTESPITGMESVSKTPFYCKICKQSVENMSLKKHLSSTIHNFNAASKKKMPTMYGIPESNRGFQILLKSGWDKEAGLGPSGEGHKFPPKTILKQDRTGLGAKQYKPRVTHSLDALQEARKEAKPKDTFKLKLKSQKSKEQRLERNLRVMLS